MQIYRYTHRGVSHQVSILIEQRAMKSWRRGHAMNQYQGIPLNGDFKTMEQTDKEAYKLAKTYNLLPDQKKAGRGPKGVDVGKYEPDLNPEAASRTIVIASYIGRCNLLVRYSPAELDT